MVARSRLYTVSYTRRYPLIEFLPGDEDCFSEIKSIREVKGRLELLALKPGMNEAVLKRFALINDALKQRRTHARPFCRRGCHNWLGVFAFLSISQRGEGAKA